MATNPKLPEFPHIPPRKTGDQHGKVQVIKKSRFPWPIFILIVGAVLLAGILYFSPRAPRTPNAPAGAQVPAQPTPAQVELTNMKIESSPVGGAVYLTGILHNAGNTAINGVEVEVQFIGRNGVPVGSESRPLQGLRNGTTSEELTAAPIQANQSRPIRIDFEHTPAGWNHQLPTVTVTVVTGSRP
jgi:Protein of unknown function (DUF3426)